MAWPFTWPSLLLAGICQLLAGGAIAFQRRLSRRDIMRLAVALLAADVLIVLLLLLTSEIAGLLNRGPHRQRVLAIFLHLSVAGILSWTVCAVALSTALRRRSILSGGLLAAVSFAGMAAPGIRPSDAGTPATVNQVTVAHENLPSELDGLRIILVSDLHLGRIVTMSEARARLAPLSQLSADLCIFAGDLGNQGDIRSAVQLLDEMLPEGRRFAVLGNHDVWVDESLAIRQLRKHGFTVLINESHPVRIGGADLWVAGVNDLYTGGADLASALEGVPDGAFTLLLSHVPDIVGQPLCREADLILSGHTHGGQVVPPLIGPLACSSMYGPRYAFGLFDVGESKLFVTRGVGEVVIPMRVFCDPEIAVLQLHSATTHPRR